MQLAFRKFGHRPGLGIGISIQCGFRFRFRPGLGLGFRLHCLAGRRNVRLGIRHAVRYISRGRGIDPRA